MEGIVSLCLSAVCVLTPIVIILLAGGVYTLGMGAVKVPGIGRREMHPGREWTTVPDLTRKASESVAAVISLVGSLFGLIGFLLPWVRVNIGAGARLLNLGGLNGTLSGIALVFQSMVAGVGLLSTNVKGATGIAAALIVVSLLVSLIPLALLLTAAVGAGLISVPLGLVKIQIQRLARMLLIMSVLSLCLTCTFFAGIQATVGGIKVEGSEGLFGSSVSIGVEVANGFWITVGGLVLTLVGSIIANTVAGALAGWAKNLTALEGEQGK